MQQKQDIILLSRILLSKRLYFILGIKTEWLNSHKTILVSDVEDGWTWDDVQSNAGRVYDLAKSVNYPVGLIVLLNRTMSIPPSGFVQNSRYVVANHAELEIHTIAYVVRVPYTMTLWEETINALVHDNSRYFIVGSFDEAVEIVEARAA